MAPLLRFAAVTLAATLLYPLTVEGGGSSALGPEPPVTVSPGSVEDFSLIESHCPTFLWGQVDGVTRYELVVFPVPEDGADDDAILPALRLTLPGAAHGYTPSLDSCLEPGTAYAWMLRAQSASGPSEWSEPALFRIAVAPSIAEVREALDVLRAYLATAEGNLTAAKAPLTEEIAETFGPAGAADRPRVARPSSPPRKSRTLVAPAATAIRGETPSGGGVTFGVHGISTSTEAGSSGVVGESRAGTGSTSGVLGSVASDEGAGVVAMNSSAGGGADLLLDGSAQGMSDTRVTESGIDRPSTGVETFDIGNSLGGGLSLTLDGVEVVTIATDQDTLGALSCASGQLPKRIGGSWSCSDDLDTDTLYGNGFGLDLAGTTFSVDSTEIQRRVLGNCPAGASVRQVNADGSVVCEVDDQASVQPGNGLLLDGDVLSLDPGFFSPSLSTVDGSAGVGRDTSIAVGTDGLGLIAHYDGVGGDLEIAHCDTADCSSATLTTLDSTGNFSCLPSIAVGTDGLGLISYHVPFTGGLRVAHCSDSSCSSATVSTISPGTNGSGSIAIGTDGRGLISYSSSVNITMSELAVAHCDDIPCTSASTTTLTGGQLVSSTSLAIGADGRGLIAYSDETDGDLEVAHCSDTACTAATFSTLDSSGDVGQSPSVALGVDGLGLISYFDATNQSLKVAHCDGTLCSSATLSTLDSAGSVGRYTSVAFGPDGLGLISYYDQGRGDLKLARCRDVICSSATVTTLDSAGDVGLYTSIALVGDGRPLVSYHDQTHGVLKAAHPALGTDADADSLGALACDSDELPKWDGGGWQCSPDLDSLSELVCASGEIPQWDGVWTCVAEDGDTLGDLACADGEVAKRNAGVWSCATDNQTVYAPGNQLTLAGDTFDVSEGPGSGLDADTLDGLDSTAFSPSSHAHDNRYYTETELSTAAGGGAVDWSNLTAVPAGFADGVDNDTTYAYGAGLALVDGVVRIDPGAFSTRISTLSIGGESTSIAIGTDGLGIISHWDSVIDLLQITHCDDVLCTTATTQELDAYSSHTSIAIGTDGLALISYYQHNNGDLYVAHCDDASCTSTTGGALDTTGDVGQYPSMVIPSDGRALITYYDATDGDLWMARCIETSCDGAGLRSLDAGDDVGQYGAMAIGADGFALISYYDLTNGDLKVLHCENEDCTALDSHALDSGGNVGMYTSIGSGGDGLGLISYWDADNAALKVAHCADVACTSATVTTLDSTGSVGTHTSLTIGGDGLGLISYYDELNAALKVAHCDNAFCTSATIATLDSGGDVGRHSSITIGSDGVGLISYYDSTNGMLEVAHLGLGVP